MECEQSPFTGQSSQRLEPRFRRTVAARVVERREIVRADTTPDDVVVFGSLVLEQTELWLDKRASTVAALRQAVDFRPEQ